MNEEPVFLAQYQDPTGSVHFGVLKNQLFFKLNMSFDEFLESKTAEDIERLLTDLVPQDAVAVDSQKLSLPLGQQEVWASGLNYRIPPKVLDEFFHTRPILFQIYHAKRPLLFFKSPSTKVIMTEGKIGIPRNSQRVIPEAELAILINRQGQIVAYTLGNDVTAIDLENENILYQPQAKIFTGSCALGPLWRLHTGALPTWTISCSLEREQKVLAQWSYQTSGLHRDLSQIASTLFETREFTTGAVILIGAGQGIPADLGLVPGDRVAIDCAAIGRLENTAVVV